MLAVFMGTPPFAVATLEALVRHGDTVALVITQPDRPAGRGRKLTPSAVKQHAAELGLPVYQPEKIRAPEALERLREIAPEIIVVVGYGQIIPQTIIDLPRYGIVNVHSSLLPKYRGAAPMNWAIANGETTTGVTTMRIEKRLDAGDMLLKRETAIGTAETAPQLAERLAPMGAALLIETLEGLAAGTITPEKQDEAEATYAPILKREDGWIDWERPASEIFNRIRGFDPWPGAYTSFRDKRLHVRRARALTDASLPPGRISIGQGLRAGCGGGTALQFDQLQLEGKQRITADDFVRGYRPADGEVLGEPRT
jgi:methionyl-tRNA formyltransferase